MTNDELIERVLDGRAPVDHWSSVPDHDAYDVVLVDGTEVRVTGVQIVDAMKGPTA
jgi:hypothetical protein